MQDIMQTEATAFASRATERLAQLGARSFDGEPIVAPVGSGSARVTVHHALLAKLLDVAAANWQNTCSFCNTVGDMTEMQYEDEPVRYCGRCKLGVVSG